MVQAERTLGSVGGARERPVDQEPDDHRSLIREAERRAGRRRSYTFALLIILTGWLVLRLDWIAAVDEQGQLIDPMLFSGMITAIAGLWLSLFIEGSFVSTMQRLRHDCVVGHEVHRIASMQLSLERLADRMQLVAGFGIGIVMLVGIGVVERFSGIKFGSEFTLSSVILGAIIGSRLGVIGVYGRLGSTFKRYRVNLLLVPGHPDELGGSAPIGRFILVQGLLAAIVIVWLTVWLVLLSEDQDLADYYGDWTTFFWVLWLIGAGFFVVGFILPMVQFRSLMRDAKAAIQSHVGDTLRIEIKTLHSERMAAQNPGDFLRLNAALGDSHTKQRQIDALPTIPLGHVGRRLYSLGAAGPFLTALGSFVFRDDGLKSAYGALIKWLEPLLGG